MAGEVLLNDYDHSTLRIESREALHKLGIPSNPGLTNRNIIDGLARAIGKAHSFPEGGEWTEYSGELFRDSLGELLGLEVPPAVGDVVIGLRVLRQES